MIKTILIDVDGVIADFDRAALARILGPERVEEGMKLRDKGEWSIARGLGMSESDFWKRIDDAQFWQTIPSYDGAVDFIRNLTKMAKEHFRVESFYFLTSSGGSSEFPTPRTRWIREFNKQSGVSIPLAIVQDIGGKLLCANAETLLVEDNDKNYEGFLAAGGYGVLVPRQWNKGTFNPEFSSVYGQVIDTVRRGLSGLAHDDIDR